MNIKERLSALRTLMRENNMDAYVIPSGDAHNTPYVADYWRTREWISGLTGSAGIVVVTAETAGLWVDGRYFIQAERELEGSGIQLFKIGGKNNVKQVKRYKNFLAEVLPDGGNLGFDGRMMTAHEFKEMKATLKDKGITYSYKKDLIGELWQDRPPLSTEPAFEHELSFAGESASKKLEIVRAKMKEKTTQRILFPH